MRIRANSINLNLEEKCTLLISNFWKETRNLYIRRGQRERKVYVSAIYLLGTTYTFLLHTQTKQTNNGLKKIPLGIITGYESGKKNSPLEFFSNRDKTILLHKGVNKVIFSGKILSKDMRILLLE